MEIEHREGLAGDDPVTLYPRQVIEDGESVELEGLRTFLREHLSGYKLPRSLTVVPEIPRNATGKAQYPRAKEMILADHAGAGSTQGAPA